MCTVQPKDTLARPFVPHSRVILDPSRTAECGRHPPDGELAQRTPQILEGASPPTATQCELRESMEGETPASHALRAPRNKGRCNHERHETHKRRTRKNSHPFARLTQDAKEGRKENRIENGCGRRPNRQASPSAHSRPPHPCFPDTKVRLCQENAPTTTPCFPDIQVRLCQENILLWEICFPDMQTCTCQENTPLETPCFPDTRAGTCQENTRIFDQDYEVRSSNSASLFSCHTYSHFD